MQSISLAITTGIFQVPPAYFLTHHAEYLRTHNPSELQINTRYFSLVSDVADEFLSNQLFTAVRPNILTNHKFSFAARAALIPLFSKRIDQALARFSPDVVHQHFATWSGPARRYCARTNTPLLVTLNGYDAFAASSVSYHPYNELLSRQACKVMDQADVIFAVSNFLASQAIRAGADSKKLQVLYHGVDTDIFNLANKQENEFPKVIAVGHLTHQKGVLDLVQASIKIFADFPHQLIFVGDGPLRQEISNAQKEHPHINLLGQLCREELVKIYQQSDVHVLATKPTPDGRQEAAGQVTLEAQACGTPAITTNCGGASEILKPDETGIVANFGDVDSLAHQLTTILDMPVKERWEMGKRGRNFVVAHRSVQNTAKILSSTYQQLIK